MTESRHDIHETPGGILFKVHVQPRSSRNRILGPFGDALKIAVTAPPVNEAANRMVIEVLAKALGTPTSALAILSGQTSRTKRIRWTLDSDSVPHGLEAVRRLFAIGAPGTVPSKLMES